MFLYSVHIFFCTHASANGVVLTERLYTQTPMLLNTGACAQKPLHFTHMCTHDFTQKTLCTQKVPTHRGSHFRTASLDAPRALTHNSIYTEDLLDRESFTCRFFYERSFYSGSFYTLVPLPADAFCTGAFTCLYTLTPLRTGVFTGRSLLTKVHLRPDILPYGHLHTYFGRFF